MDESSYISSLPERYQQKYKQMKEGILITDFSQFETERQEFKKEIYKEIEIDEKHRCLVNMCIYPFIQKEIITEKLRYHFVRAEPLYELGIKNLDFLIYCKPSKIAIFGEAKSSISDPKKVVKEFQERINQITKQQNYISDNYIGETPRLYEYVLAVYSLYDEDAIKAVADLGGGIIVWSADRMFKKISMKTFMSEKDAIKRKIIHADKKLRRVFSKHDTLTNVFNVFPSSHIINYLKLIVRTRHHDDVGWSVTEEQLARVLKMEIPYATRQFINEKKKLIIEYALRTRIIQPTSISGEYRLTKQISSPQSLNTFIVKKYIKYKTEEKKKAVISKSIQKAISATEEFKKRYPTLESFPNLNRQPSFHGQE